jgi:murein DD-endopeptidase MepM/ murein hydrolase activator NlpD
VHRFVNRNSWVLVGLLIASGALSACDNQAQQATAVPIQSPIPTEDDLATLIAMQQQATRVPSATPIPTVTPTFTPSPTATPTLTFTPTDTPLPTNTLTIVATSRPPSYTPYPTNTPRTLPTLAPSAVAVAMYEQVREIRDHYWFARPFPRDSTNTIQDYPSRSYSYGTMGDSLLQPHHGEDFQNTTGTPILAVADGWVFYAGSDEEVKFGPQNDFYGNLVVIEHDLKAPDGRTLYTLYGHMSHVDVQTGQRVTLQERIGQVGSTGVALGPHLHLEVRIGDPYDYGSTYNPDLWVRPWSGYGTLIGRVTDSTGNKVYSVTISIEPESGPNRTTYSYADDYVNSDPYYGENFSYGDLPAGNYQVTVRKRGILRYKGSVTVEAGQTNWLDIVMN